MEKTDTPKPFQSNTATLKYSNIVIAIFIFFAALMIVAYTIPQYGITWDEPLSFFDGVERIDKWVKEIKKEMNERGIISALSRDITTRYWQPPNPVTQKYDFYNNHPPITRIAGYLSWRLLSNISNDLSSMCFAAAIAYALMVTVIFLLGCLNLDINHKPVAKTERDSVPLVVLFAPN